MSTFLDVSRVKYVSENSISPLCEFYFCRHCLKLKSKVCVSHEVDSLYCQNCLESMPAAEAKTWKNCCASCFECPSCSHALTTRATSILSDIVDADGLRVPKKAFYLACAFCRWTSRDVGIKDQFVSSGGWAEQESPYAKRIIELVEYYKQLAIRDLNENKKKKLRRKNYFQLPEKLGLGHLSARRKSGYNMAPSKDSAINTKFDEMATESVPTDQFEKLTDNFFTEPIELTKLTNISQRLRSPQFQPIKIEELYPLHKHLLIKCSQRCRQCDHNLSKPEYNPSAIKFKIQLLAIHHVPEIKIKTLPELKFNERSQFVLTIFNPLEFSTIVTFKSLEPELDDFSTAIIHLPSIDLAISKCEDTMVFDDNLDQSPITDDDPSIVVFRRGSSVGIFAAITPQVESGEIKVKFCLKYKYQSRVLSTKADKDSPSEIEATWLENIIHLYF